MQKQVCWEEQQNRVEEGMCYSTQPRGGVTNSINCLDNVTNLGLANSRRIHFKTTQSTTEFQEEWIRQVLPRIDSKTGKCNACDDYNRIIFSIMYIVNNFRSLAA